MRWNLEVFTRAKVKNSRNLSLIILSSIFKEFPVFFYDFCIVVLRTVCRAAVVYLKFWVGLLALSNPAPLPDACCIFFFFSRFPTI